MILSTGMANMDEIAESLGVLAYGYLGGNQPARAAFGAAFASAEGQAALRSTRRCLCSAWAGVLSACAVVDERANDSTYYVRRTLEVECRLLTIRKPLG